jgi:hypothetical protein
MIHHESTVPEFCPNPACPFHHRDTAATTQWWVRFGTFWTRARGRIQRFRCLHCRRTCSTQTFSVHYWTHSTNDLPWLLAQLSTCAGLRQIGRVAGVTHRVIQNRCRRLARNALAVMDLALSGLELREHLAMDGFESFTRSQYHPNNLTHITGCDSQFIYAAVHTLFRRKGTMTRAQKRHRSVIDAVYRPQTTIAEQCAHMLGDLERPVCRACDTGSEPLELRTDEHTAYPGAIASVASFQRRLAERTLVHDRTSSRAARTTANPLFAVNYVDRQLRTSLAEYVRETTRQGREVNAQMERFAIFMVVHNFLTPHRVSGKARVIGEQTHADVAGVTDEKITDLLRRMTTHRHVYSHTSGFRWWIRRIWQRLHDNPPAVGVRRGVVQSREVCLPVGAIPRYLLA